MNFRKTRTNYLMIAVATTGLFSLGSLAIASADTTTSTNHIPRYTLKETRLNAEAVVLDTSPTSLENTLKTETMKQLLASKGLTRTAFRTQVKAEVTKELQADGYTTAQIDGTRTYHHRHAKKS